MRTADGKPNLLSEVSDKPLSIPCQLNDLKVEIASGKLIAVYLPAVNLYLVWDLEVWNIQLLIIRVNLLSFNGNKT